MINPNGTGIVPTTEPLGELGHNQASRYEANLPLVEFSITINVSTEKKFRLDFWKNLTAINQQSILSTIIIKIFLKFNILIDYIFEKTKQGFYHLHGKFCIHKDNEYERITSLQNFIHKTLGIRYFNPRVVCRIERTFKSIMYWDMYMQKDQAEDDSIPKYNMIAKSNNSK